MSTAPTIPPLTGTITVDVPVERAFRTFTDAFGSWWPAEYHIGQADMATAILEPRAGGRWYEQGVDGSECDWGRVLASLTNSTEQVARAQLEHAGLLDSFELVLSADTVHRLKPAPERT
jgi:hypothetical protein